MILIHRVQNKILYTTSLIAATIFTTSRISMMHINNSIRAESFFCSYSFPSTNFLSRRETNPLYSVFSRVHVGQATIIARR